MNWPPALLDIFETCRHQHIALEARYYGPYDALLNYLTSRVAYRFEFFIAPAPQCIPNTIDQNQLVDFVVCLRDRDGPHANLEQKPVIIVEVKDDQSANSATLRLQADEQIRIRFHQMLPNCPIPRLYGISFLGTSMRVYCGDTATGDVIPELIDNPDPDSVPPPDLLEGRWDIDVLSPVGAMRMHEVMWHIARMVDQADPAEE